jgi:hypothetical protein
MGTLSGFGLESANAASFTIQKRMQWKFPFLYEGTKYKNGARVITKDRLIKACPVTNINSAFGHLGCGQNRCRD